MTGGLIILTNTGKGGTARAVESMHADLPTRGKDVQEDPPKGSGTSKKKTAQDRSKKKLKKKSEGEGRWFKRTQEIAREEEEGSQARKEGDLREEKEETRREGKKDSKTESFADPLRMALK